MFAKDSEEHKRIRGVVNREFTPKRIERLRPDCKRLADALCDAIPVGEPFDFWSAFAVPYAGRVTCRLVGSRRPTPSARACVAFDLVRAFFPFMSAERRERAERSRRRDPRLHGRPVSPVGAPSPRTTSPRCSRPAPQRMRSRRTRRARLLRTWFSPGSRRRRRRRARAHTSWSHTASSRRSPNGPRRPRPPRPRCSARPTPRRTSRGSPHMTWSAQERSTARRAGRLRQYRGGLSRPETLCEPRRARPRPRTG